jgi:hypothetical protein
MSAPLFRVIALKGNPAVALAFVVAVVFCFLLSSFAAGGRPAVPFAPAVVFLVVIPDGNLLSPDRITSTQSTPPTFAPVLPTH